LAWAGTAKVKALAPRNKAFTGIEDVSRRFLAPSSPSSSSRAQGKEGLPMVTKNLVYIESIDVARFRW
jgi:hypothetical protein